MSFSGCNEPISNPLYSNFYQYEHVPRLFKNKANIKRIIFKGYLIRLLARRFMNRSCGKKGKRLPFIVCHYKWPLHVRPYASITKRLQDREIADYFRRSCPITDASSSKLRNTDGLYHAFAHFLDHFV